MSFSQSQMSMQISLPKQVANASAAKKRKLKAEAGVGPQVGGNKFVDAQFNPGRGAELSWTRQNLLPAIKFKTGESLGPPSVSAYDADQKFYKGQKISTGFAFKAILNADLVLNEEVVATRFYCHNIFRHTKAEACGVDFPSNYASTQVAWNTTLGPDGSAVRLAPTLGTAYPPTTGPGSAVGEGFDQGLYSPYRYPQQGTAMFSRLTRQNLENFMWNCNPMKLAYIQPENNGNLNQLSLTPLAVYDNATSDTSGGGITSHPWQQRATVATGSGVLDPKNNSGYYYKCQSGIGHVAYHFNNDGTSPVVVDVVVTRVKKGAEVSIGSGALADSYSQGYQNYLFNNRGQGDYFGQLPAGSDCLDNARHPFMPAKALAHSIPIQQFPASGTPTEVRPFKQVARDQFVISGGATRPWSIDLQAMNYRANDYTQCGEDPDMAISSKNFDDLSYAISFGFSTLAIPLTEVTNNASGNKVAVIDRVPQSVNVSVTGVYTENVLPVYLSNALRTPFINGALDYAYYFGPNQGPLPTLVGIDIANAGNIVRSEAQSSAFISVGPTNTQPGA